MKIGSGPERELARAQRHRAGEIGRQHVGGELHAPEVDADRAGERVGEQRLGDAGHAFEQDVSADGGAREQYLDDMVLTDDDLAHFVHDAVA